MARPHCEKHKRYVPYCDDCKAAVAAVETQSEEQAEEAEAVPVGGMFPADETPPEATPEDSDGADAEAASEALKAEVGFPGAIDETEAAMSEAGEFDPEPAIEIDGDGNIVPVKAEDPTEPFSVPFPDPDATVTRPVPVEVTPESSASEDETLDVEGSVDVDLDATAAAYVDGEKAGRKQTIAWVKEWFADSTDTGAFQLLEFLNKKAR